MVGGDGEEAWFVEEVDLGHVAVFENLGHGSVADFGGGGGSLT